MHSIVFSLVLIEVIAVCDSGCDCVAIPGNNQQATDAHCQPCATGQSWWPCNQEGLCQCQGDVISTPAPVAGEECKPGCSSCTAMPSWMEDSTCDTCLTGYKYWPCDNADLCRCEVESSPTTVGPTTESPVSTSAPTTDSISTTATPTTTEDAPCPTTEAPTTGIPTTGAPVPETSTTNAATTDAPTTAAPTTDASTTNSDVDIDRTVRKAQATVFGDYTNISWNQVLCSQDESDAKAYMQGNPICATAISMSSQGVQSQGTVDQNGNPGFCTRYSPGAGAAKASSCWKVRCVGGDNALNVGVSCKHHDWIYLKTVDTNMENPLSLTDDAFTQQCANVQTNTPSCRAFDITVQAWDLMVVFASNQGPQAGQPAGLNGIIPIEYEEVDCNDTVVSAAIQSSHCGLPSQLII